MTVWYRLTESLDEAALASDAALLDDEERARSRRFVNAHDSRDFVAAHGLLRRALSRQRPIDPAVWQFESGAGGKPTLAAVHRGTPPLAFNLSHTRGLVACVVASAAQVGIDVESNDRGGDIEAIADRFFHPFESARLRDCPQTIRRSRFLELWTLKEAYLKGVGAGLSMSMQDCVFELDGAGDVRFSPASSVPDGWQFAVYGVAGDRYRMAIAWRDDIGARTPNVQTLDGDQASHPLVLLAASKAGE